MFYFYFYFLSFWIGSSRNWCSNLLTLKSLFINSFFFLFFVLDDFIVNTRQINAETHPEKGTKVLTELTGRSDIARMNWQEAEIWRLSWKSWSEGQGASSGTPIDPIQAPVNYFYLNCEAARDVEGEEAVCEEAFRALDWECYCFMPVWFV